MRTQILILVRSVVACAVALAPVNLRAQEQIFDPADDALFEDRDVFERRDLFDRPRPPVDLYKSTEAMVDRGAGRIDEETRWLLERNLLIPDLADPRAPIERLEDLTDRDWRLWQRQLQRDRRGRIVERESERLAERRIRWRSERFGAPVPSMSPSTQPAATQPATTRSAP